MPGLGDHHAADGGERRVVAQRVHGVRGPTLLHHDRGGPRVVRAGGEQAGDRVGEHLTGDVVDVGLEESGRPSGIVRPSNRAAPSPMTAWTTLGRPDGSAVPAPKPLAVTVIGGNAPKRLGQHRHQGHSGRRGGLHRRVDADRRSTRASEQGGDGRDRVRQLAVGRAHGAVPDRDRAADDGVDAEDLERDADTDDVDDRVERTDLVELDVVGGDAMDLAFDLGERAVDGQRPFADAVGEVRPRRSTRARRGPDGERAG